MLSTYIVFLHQGVNPYAAGGQFDAKKPDKWAVSIPVPGAEHLVVLHQGFITINKGYFRPKHKDTTILENHLNMFMLVFIS